MAAPSLLEGNSLRHLSLHRPLSLPLRLDVWPFIALYGTVLYILWQGFSGWADQDVLLAALLAVIVIFHAIMFLLCYWVVRVRVFSRFATVSPAHYATATHALACPPVNKGRPGLCKLRINAEGKTVFDFQQRQYVLDKESLAFRRERHLHREDLNVYENATGYETEEEVKASQRKWGRNEVVIPPPAFWDMYKQQMLAPFFVFQVFCVLLWCLDEYWYASLHRYVD